VGAAHPRGLRLTFAHGRLLDETAQRRAELEASRGRLLTTTDRERENLAARLRDETLAPLRRAAQSLTPLTDAVGASTTASTALSQALEEVSSTEAEIGRIVSGVPPVALGEGRIGDAVRGLARLAGPHVDVAVDANVSGTTDAETALFYVCSESLSNAAKHAMGSVVTVSLRRVGERLVLAVNDDGPGGGRHDAGRGSSDCATGWLLRVER